MAYKFEAKPYFQPAHFGPWPVEPVLHGYGLVKIPVGVGEEHQSYKILKGCLLVNSGVARYQRGAR